MYEALGINRYQETDVTTMGPEKMVVLLYEKVVNFLQRAREQLAGQERHLSLQRVNAAQAIILELRNALDHTVGGELSRNLELLYDYLFQENLSFLVDRDATHLDNNIRVLTPLLDAWRRIPPGAAEEALRQLSNQNPSHTPASGPDPAKDTTQEESEAANDASDADRDAPPQFDPAGQHGRPNLVSVSA